MKEYNILIGFTDEEDCTVYDSFIVEADDFDDAVLQARGQIHRNGDYQHIIEIVEQRD